MSSNSNNPIGYHIITWIFCTIIIILILPLRFSGCRSSVEYTETTEMDTTAIMPMLEPAPIDTGLYEYNTPAAVDTNATY
jgi:hypothetical protein